MRPGSLNPYGCNMCMWMRAANDRGVQKPWKFDVIDKPTPTTE
jgi:hypothetical protein